MAQSILVSHHHCLHVGVIREKVIAPHRGRIPGHSCPLSVGSSFKGPQENGAVSSTRRNQGPVVGKEAAISHGTPVASILAEVLKDGRVAKNGRDRCSRSPRALVKVTSGAPHQYNLKRTWEALSAGTTFSLLPAKGFGGTFQ